MRWRSILRALRRWIGIRFYLRCAKRVRFQPIRFHIWNCLRMLAAIRRIRKSWFISIWNWFLFHFKLISFHFQLISLDYLNDSISFETDFMALRLSWMFSIIAPSIQNCHVRILWKENWFNLTFKLISRTCNHSVTFLNYHFLNVGLPGRIFWSRESTTICGGQSALCIRAWATPRPCSRSTSRRPVNITSLSKLPSSSTSSSI